MKVFKKGFLVVAAFSSTLLVASNDARADVTSDFINRVADPIRSVTKQYNLYGSVMMAQASGESGWGQSTLASRYNNYFGIKGSYNGQSVPMLTTEYVNGQPIQVVANFKVYPDIRSSMEDNAKLLRNGLYWAPDYYSGTWRENAKTYAEAAYGLQDRYATDPYYASKLINLIKDYGMDKIADEQPISVTDSKKTNYLAQITWGEVGLYTGNAGTVDGAEKVNNASAMMNEYVVVKEERTTSDGITWIGFDKGGRTLWMQKGGVTATNGTPINQQMMFLPSTTGTAKLFKNGPYGAYGYEVAGKASDLNYKPFYVESQIQINNQTYYYGRTLQGDYYWIDAGSAVIDNSAAIRVDYTATVIDSGKNGFAYEDLPGEYKTTNIGTNDKFYGKSIRVVNEWTTPDDVTWAGFDWNGHMTYVRKESLKTLSMTNYTNFKFTMVPTDSQMLYKVPFWYVGASEFQRAANYKWQIVTVIREMTDVNGDTWYGAYFGADFAWFCPAAGKIENTKPKKIDKTATLNEFGRSANAYVGMPGEFTTTNAGVGEKFFGKNIRVTSSWTTAAGVEWYGFEWQGQWIYMRSSQFKSVSDTKNINLTVTIDQTNRMDSYYLTPSWYVNAQVGGSMKDLDGRTIKVTKQMTDLLGTVWYETTIGGKPVWFMREAGRQTQPNK